MNKVVEITWNCIPFKFYCYIQRDSGDRDTPASPEFRIESISAWTHQHQRVADWIFENIDDGLFRDLRAAVEEKAFAEEY